MDLNAALAGVLGEDVIDLRRLSGGASRETWSFAVGDGTRRFVVQRRRSGTSELAGDIGLEADLLRAAADAGVAVPSVVASGDGRDDSFGAPWMLCEFLDGEALPRTLLRDDAFAGVRSTLARECGAALARIHSIDTAPFGDRLVADDQIARMRDVIDLTSGSRPALEAALRFLERHPPVARPDAVVHGDYRTGNLLVRPDAAAPPGLAAVLDWELAHLGNPVEDLGWFCVRAWRFGSPHRAGGFGPVSELLDGYESVSGVRIGDDELDWWELYGTVRWGVICAVQAESHLSGAARSVELATIGRRAAENEYDALRLLGAPFPDAISMPEVLEVPEAAPAPLPIHDRPTASELIEAVREFLSDDVAGATEGRVRFHARVAANALSIVERELAAGERPAVDHARRLAVLGVSDDAELAAAIRAGDLDDRWDELLAALAATVLDKVRVANPRHLHDAI